MSSDELRLIALAATPDIVEEQPLDPTADLLARIDELWATAPPGSFDGRIFSVRELDPGTIQGGFVPYRYYFASRRDDAVAEELALLPLGVSGIIRSAAGILFGRRAGQVTDFAGRWELAPSGGVAPDCRRNGELSLEAQVLSELAEETPFDDSDVSAVRAFVLAVDRDIVDVCFDIEIASESSKSLTSTAEYAELRWVEDVERFIADHDVIDLSKRLARWGL